jgi:hypothetical protein
MGIFSFGGRMNVTLKIKNNMNGMESWSEPYEVAVQEASNNPLITHFSTSFEMRDTFSRVVYFNY